MIRTTDLRNLFLSLLVAAGAFAAPAYSQVNISIGFAPPAPQYEVVPVMQPGYVWAPGYWGWSGERHVWIRGRPIAQRDGYRWQPDRWDERDSKYYRNAGHWERDNDYRGGKGNNGKHKGWDNDNGKGKGDKHRD